MHSLVIIPCYRRPEFLAAALRCVENARGAADQEYLFAIDRGADPLIDEVIATFKFLPQSRVVKRSHAYHGPAFNILESYREAMKWPGIDLVHLIEEDVFVAEDYFEYHEDAHDLDDDAVFVSACLNQNIDKNLVMSLCAYDGKADNASAVYRHVSYQSLGVSLAPWFLGEFIEHANAQYYAAPIAYCEVKLPDAKLPRDAASQDGLIHRVIRRDVRWGVYPHVPRAFHAGFYGQNRQGQRMLGHWRDAAEQLLAMSSDQMNKLGDPEFQDIARAELIRPCATLKLV